MQPQTKLVTTDDRAKVLRSIRDAFIDAETETNHKSNRPLKNTVYSVPHRLRVGENAGRKLSPHDLQQAAANTACCNVMQSVCAKAGAVLYSLISNGCHIADRLPDTLKSSPTMTDRLFDPDDGDVEGEVNVTHLYWLAFIGWATRETDIPVTTTERYTSAVLHEYEYANGDFDRFQLHCQDAMDVWPKVCRSSVHAIDFLLGLLGTKVESTDSNVKHTNVEQHERISNPSAPICKKEAAQAWGKGMTVKKLSGLMESGKIRYKEFNRQTFIFDRDQIPSLPAN